MQITLDHETIGQAINLAVTSAITEGVTQWDLKKAIAAEAVAAVNKADLPARVGRVLQDRLAEEIDSVVHEAVAAAMPAIRLSVAESARHMAALMLYGLREGAPAKYDQDGGLRFRACLDLINNSDESLP